MSSVLPFTRAPVRALVIEQLNADQWHVAVQGGDVPDGSFESRGSGVASFSVAALDAIEVAELTGLPVLVAPYLEAPRPLSSVRPSRAFWRQRFRRSTSLDHIMYGEGDAA